MKSQDLQRMERQIAEGRELGGGFIRRLKRRSMGDDAPELERLREADAQLQVRHLFVGWLCNQRRGGRVPDSAGSHRPRWLLPLVGAVIGVAIVVTGLLVVTGGDDTDLVTYEVPSESMLPTYAVGDSITADRNAYQGAAPAIGDVVIFRPPRGADNGIECGVRPAVGEPCPKATDALSNQVFLKRVVAVPGDTFSIVNGHPVVNGEQVEESFTEPCGSAPACDMRRTITIPPGDYFMLGDNRGASDDSRFWGPVPAAAIIGRVE